MKRFIAFTAVFALAVTMFAAPVMAGSGCESLKAGKCAITGKACTSAKDATTTDATAEKKMSCSNATMAVEGLKDAEAVEKLGKMLGEAEGIYCVEKFDTENGQAVICFDPATTDATKLAAAMTEFGFATKVLSTAEGHMAGCTPEKMAECKKPCPMSGEKK
ncbi:MAG: hypothetical protein AB1746_06725 [Candidatus Zixiibacteriota bacterium]